MNYNKSHYKKNKRGRFSGKQGELFVSLFSNEQLRELAHLHYVEGEPLLVCAEKMNFSNRTIERLHQTLKDVAIEELMKLVGSCSDNAVKLLKIQNILSEK